MIKEYIEDKLRTNRLQFEILDREYKTIRKSEGEINEHIRRLQEDDDIDFVIFSPRSLKYSTKNSIAEYDRKLQDLIQERETVKGKMNRLLEQKLELDRMFQEAEEKQLESSYAGENSGGSSDSSRDGIDINSNGINEENSNGEVVEIGGISRNAGNSTNAVNSRNAGSRTITQSTDGLTSAKSEKAIEEQKIKNWNEKGTIKIKTNGNTGKFFDALAHKKGGSTSARVVRTGLNPNLKLDYNSENSKDRREIKNVLEKNRGYEKNNILEKDNVLERSNVLDKSIVLENDKVLEINNALGKNKVMDGNNVLEKNNVLDKSIVLEKSNVLESGISDNNNTVEKSNVIDSPVNSFINIVEGRSIDEEDPANNINIRSNNERPDDKRPRPDYKSNDNTGINRFINIIEGPDKRTSVLDKEENDVVNFGNATDSSLENKFLSNRSKGRKTGDKVIRSDDMQKLLSKIELCQKLLVTNKEECNIELKNLKYVLENLM